VETITQQPDPCLTSLSVNAASLSTKNYNYLPNPFTETEPIANIITDSLPGLCPISSCTLLAQGCMLPYSTGLLDVSILAAPPNTISVNQMKFDGSNVHMCVECTNGVQTLQADNWLFSQVQGTCLYALDPITTPLITPKTYQYDVTVTAEISYVDW